MLLEPMNYHQQVKEAGYVVAPSVLDDNEILRTYAKDRTLLHKLLGCA